MVCKEGGRSRPASPVSYSIPSGGRKKRRKVALCSESLLIFQGEWRGREGKKKRKTWKELGHFALFLAPLPLS